MPATSIDDSSIYYEVLGEGSATVVLTPGGRNPLDTARALGEQLARDFRVILWDRANIGRSDVQFSGARDLDLWSDQLAALLRRLDAVPAYLCAPSAGGRVSFVTALRYPAAVRGLYLWLLSGGGLAERLGHGYYGQFADMAEQDGMEAVVADAFWAERIAQNPANRGRLLAQAPSEFARVMRRWKSAIREDDPLFGATEDDLRRLRTPTAILAANEDTGHPRERSMHAAGLIPGADYIEDEEFQAEWPELQRQALANYEQPRALPRLIRDWIRKVA
jgi:pimeloyl-ACP methyl ester carboxylesterase